MPRLEVGGHIRGRIMATVVIVDGCAVGRSMIENILVDIGGGIRIQPFADPYQALAWMRAYPPDLVLVLGPNLAMGGAEFVARLRQTPNCAELPLVYIGGGDDKEARYRILEEGATDFLSTPIDYRDCRIRFNNLLRQQRRDRDTLERIGRLEGKIREATLRLDQWERETLLRLAKAGECRYESIGDHGLRIAGYSRLIAQTLGLSPDQCEIIERSAPMHDIGMIGIADEILRKTDGLDGQERQAMQTHTSIGYEILKNSASSYLQAGAEIALSHHERFDGEGYPQGLKGGEIPLAARIVAVADVFEALVVARRYRAAWPFERAIDYLTRQRQRQFDADCVDAFLARLDLVNQIRSHGALPAEPGPQPVHVVASFGGP